MRTLKYSDHEPLGNTRTRFIKDVFFKAIEEESHGRLKIDDYWNSEVAISYEALGAVAEKGLADMTVAVPEYTPQRLPLHLLFKGFPVGPSGQAQVQFFRQVVAEVPEFGQELARNNVVNVFTAAGYPLAFFSSKPLASPSAIGGQKWRTASFWHKDFLKALGAEPVTMPWNEGISQALTAVTLDGIMVNLDGGRDFHIAETAPNILTAKSLWMGHVYLLVMNKQTWDSLPAQDQQAIGRAAAKAYQTLGAALDQSFDDEVARLRAAKANVRVLGPQEVAAWQTATHYLETQDAWAKTQERNGVTTTGAVLQQVRAILAKRPK